jgi:hypothetical protein
MIFSALAALGLYILLLIATARAVSSYDYMGEFPDD